MGCGPKTPLQQYLPSTSTQDVKAEDENGEGNLELGILTPSQIDSSMVDSYVKVRGKITMVNRDAGGLALWLGDDKNKVGVRIENKFWEGLTSEEQSQYEKGKTITAEGMLVLAGESELFIVLGTEPPVSEGQAQLSEGEFWDDLGCFSKDCESMPPGMKEMCEDYASGIFPGITFWIAPCCLRDPAGNCANGKKLRQPRFYRTSCQPTRNLENLTNHKCMITLRAIIKKPINLWYLL